MGIWRYVAAAALLVLIALVARQIQRFSAGATGNDALTWSTLLAAAATGAAVLVWTWAAIGNVARLIGPTSAQRPPDAWRAVALWVPSFAFLTVVGVFLVWLSGVVNTPDAPTGSSVVLIVGALCLLVSVPLTYLPVAYVADAVRRVGGRSADVVKWMWVPVVLAVVVAAGAIAVRATDSVDAVDADIPLRPVGLVVFLPSLVVLLIVWRAGTRAEEAIGGAAQRRGFRVPWAHHTVAAAAPVDPLSIPLDARTTATGSGGAPSSLVSSTSRIRQLPGSEWMRFGIVVSLAGFALLGLVGAVVMFMFWQETVDGQLLPAQRERAIDALDTLYIGERAMLVAATAMVALWSFVAVLNIRWASGQRRNPLIAALAWPAAFVGVWAIAERLVSDQSSTSNTSPVEMVVGFALQAVVVFVPFALLERSADSIAAPRGSLRITYVLVVVLLVYAQGLARLSSGVDGLDDASYGRVAGYLAVGSLLALASTLAVTDACRAMTAPPAALAERHNRLVDERERAAAASTRQPPAASVGSTALPAVAPSPAPTSAGLPAPSASTMAEPSQ
ncbi:MAG: hypothetical protein AAGA42_12805 [Actinomycetota bacterium]